MQTLGRLANCASTSRTPSASPAERMRMHDGLPGCLVHGLNPPRRARSALRARSSGICFVYGCAAARFGRTRSRWISGYQKLAVARRMGAALQRVRTRGGRVAGGVHAGCICDALQRSPQQFPYRLPLAFASGVLPGLAVSSIALRRTGCTRTHAVPAFRIALVEDPVSCASSSGQPCRSGLRRHMGEVWPVSGPSITLLRAETP